MPLENTNKIIIKVCDTTQFVVLKLAAAVFHQPRSVTGPAVQAFSFVGVVGVLLLVVVLLLLTKK